MNDKAILADEGSEDYAKVLVDFKKRMGVREADKYLGIKHGTVRGAIERGEIVPMRVPGYTRYYVTAQILAKWVAEYCMPA